MVDALYYVREIDKSHKVESTSQSIQCEKWGQY